MMALVFLPFIELLLVAVLNHIKFTANDRFDIVFGGLVEKIKSPEHVAVVGNGHSIHLVLLSFLEHLIYS